MSDHNEQAKIDTVRDGADSSMDRYQGAAAQMPSYVCHKHVYALQIQKREGNKLFFCDGLFAPMVVDPKLFSRYQPVCGDYYVVYEDGYKSISPQKVFEAGYTRKY